ncbi:TIGR03936 family radical SAM-associated protein [uncultured Jatrophihabitans sp.]|uniref:TIGR03936 family radical SAM-associated protein n=1 Tax=uncultured Jatrophihabitans sp. TaxID=1610747 RepID=UPI0035CA4A74
MARRTPDGPPPPPVVQRVRIRYAKRGRLRFASHRDFARSFERALRRAEVPMGYSAGFSPHPKISYVGGAAPTGVASEAEYVEIGLAREVDVEQLRARLNAALPDGLDLLDAVLAGPGSLAERITGTEWHIELPGVPLDEARRAVRLFLDQVEVGVERMTKNGRRTVDVRAPIVRLSVADDTPGEAGAAPCAEGAARSGGSRAILTVVVRQVIPTVRPDDVVAALAAVAGLAPAAPPLAVRLAQGPLDDDGVIGDPLDADRMNATTAS